MATTLRVNLDLDSGFVAGVKSYMVNPSSHVPDLVSGPGEVLTSYVTDLVSGFRGKYMDIRRN